MVECGREERVEVSFASELINPVRPSRDASAVTNTFHPDQARTDHHERTWERNQKRYEAGINSAGESPAVVRCAMEKAGLDRGIRSIAVRASVEVVIVEREHRSRLESDWTDHEQAKHDRQPVNARKRAPMRRARDDSRSVLDSGVERLLTSDLKLVPGER